MVTTDEEAVSRLEALTAGFRMQAAERRREEERISGNVVYALVDPRDGLIRYVGSTTNALARRSSHRSRSRSGNDEKDAWVTELKTLGLEPEFRVLEKVKDQYDLDGAERLWAKKLRTEGVVLFNKQDGGRPTRSKRIELKPGQTLEIRGRYGTVTILSNSRGNLVVTEEATP